VLCASQIVSPDGLPKFGLVTLWDVLKFDAHHFVRMMTSVAEVQGMQKLTTYGGNPSGFESQWMPDELTSQMPDVLGKLRQQCEDSLLLSASDLIEERLEIFRLAGGRINIAEYIRFDGELNKRIEHDLKRKKFYQLKPETAHLFESVMPFGEAVQSSFPSASHDIEEACKCFACDRYDATVYHLSRAMESPLRCLARTLHINKTPGWPGNITKIVRNLKTPKIRLSRNRRSFLSNP